MKIKMNLISFVLLTIICGMLYAFPLIMTFQQFILAQLGYLIFIKCSFITNSFQLIQLYIYGCILAILMLIQYNEIQSFAIGICLGLIENIVNQNSKEFSKQKREIKNSGLMFYSLYFLKYDQAVSSLLTFFLISITRLLNYNTLNKIEQEQEINIYQPMQGIVNNTYFFTFKLFIVELQFFFSLYFLFQLNTFQISISMIIMILLSYTENLLEFYNGKDIYKRIAKLMLIIQILFLIQLIFYDIIQLLPQSLIIIVYFSCRPLNQFLIGQQKDQDSFSLYFISFISSLFAGIIVF